MSGTFPGGTFPGEASGGGGGSAFTDTIIQKAAITANAATLEIVLPTDDSFDEIMVNARILGVNDNFLTISFAESDDTLIGLFGRYREAIYNTASPDDAAYLWRDSTTLFLGKADAGTTEQINMTVYHPRTETWLSESYAPPTATQETRVIIERHSGAASDQIRYDRAQLRLATNVSGDHRLNKILLNRPSGITGNIQVIGRKYAI